MLTNKVVIIKVPNKPNHNSKQKNGMCGNSTLDNMVQATIKFCNTV